MSAMDLHLEFKQITDCLAGQHDEELNIAAHEWDGWTKISIILLSAIKGYRRVIRGINREGLHDEGLNFPDDLNAMALLEAKLTPEQKEDFAYQLSQVIPQNNNCGPLEGSEGDLMCHTDFDLLHASARQRLVALLLTVKPDIFQTEQPNKPK